MLLNLRLILVSGKTEEFTFSPSDSAADIAKHVYENWPMGEQGLLPRRTSTGLWGPTALIHERGQFPSSLIGIPSVIAIV
ncbi:Ubiquitin-like protein 3 [Acipenser ruthenus]|uniref:Ubiquitin-like protein 3 n=1 Tax=Acipenser ruthenus TaxID=7906 RepID=A0A444V5I2_ACIRT|nr:Ubiquitin-like protein 3 [Acipenser ruthenus]